MVVPTCLACGKHAYASWADAVGPAVRASYRQGRPMRIYRCPHFGGWHLTKRTKW